MKDSREVRCSSFHCLEEESIFTKRYAFATISIRSMCMRILIPEVIIDWIYTKYGLIVPKLGRP